jgi:predicted N-formylglutamate amidohydrolase
MTGEAGGEASAPLLWADDPPPVRVKNAGGRSLFLLLGDHAGNLVPESLGFLGLGDDDLRRHIALDIGVSQLGAALAEHLDAPFIEQRYSRLVIDCNRAPLSPESVAAVSDGTTIPANEGLPLSARKQRMDEIFNPYHAVIAQHLEGREAIVVSLHSFTPSLGGDERPWDIGVLYDGGDTGFAIRFLSLLQASGAWCIGDNRPYTMDETDYTVPRHAYPKRLPYVEIEVRQDHLSTTQGIAEMARAIGNFLVHAAVAP